MLTSRKRSSIWAHFTEDPDIQKAKCNHCLGVISIKGGSNGNLNRHMKKKHTKIQVTIKRRQRKDVSHLVSPQINPTKLENILSPSSSVAISPQQPISQYIKPAPTRKVKQINRQVVQMIAKGYHSLRTVEEDETRKLIDMVSHCPGYQLPSQKTLSQNLISDIYNEIMIDVQKKIEAAPALSLTTDVWTSSNKESYIAVTAHFLDEETKLCSALLTCKNYSDKHTSQNLCNSLEEIMAEWRITQKVVAVVSENTENNAAAVRHGEWWSAGCFAHLLNFIVQKATTHISDVLVKVKCVVEYFNQNTQGVITLTSAQQQIDLPVLKLKHDTPARWNSTYDMLERLVQVKESVITTIAILRPDLSIKDEDWAVIEGVLILLKPFYELTVEISAEKNVTLSKVIVFCNLLQGFLHKHIPQNEKVTAVQTALKNGMENSFKDLENNILYSESTALDPRFKQRGFRNHKAYEVTIKGLRNKIGKVQLSAQKEEQDVSASAFDSGSSFTDNKERSIWDEYDNEISKIIKPENKVAAGIREFDKYLNEEYLDRKKDPLQWWQERRQVYPHVYEYILKRFCVVATSVSCERIFSATGQILNERRTLLNPSEVSKLVFLHNNM